MKAIFFITILAAFISACGNNNGNNDVKSNADTTTGKKPESSAINDEKVSSDNTVAAYLQLKNALTNDNSKEAANAGKVLVSSLQELDGSSFSAEQKKVYDELKIEIKEHAEHISSNASDIEHQREHFDMLSQDIYELVKSIKPTQVLYKDHCPMYNDGKGAIWLSESKEIKNPYYGSKMLTCGTMEEEMK
jgi:hypothetical protein